MNLSPTIYFSGLNGLRAIAAIAVLFSHTTLALKNFGLDSYVFGKYADGSPKATLLAGYGVSIFFAISGFLITYLLIKEKEKKPIQIKKFYIRRILRIWPLYFVYLIIVILTLSYFNIDFNSSSILYYIFLSANIPFVLGTSIELLAHYWSLGVEEQFYLFWPNFIKHSSKILKSSIILALFLLLLKVIIYFLSKKFAFLEIPFMLIQTTRFQCMIIGGIGAILYSQKHQLFLQFFNHKISQFIAWIVILLVTINEFHVISIIDNEIVSVIALILIIGQIEKKNRLINLEYSILDFLGKISFGIYVIHPLIIFYLSRIIQFKNHDTINYIYIYCLTAIITIIIATISFKFFEKPILNLKRTFAVIKSKSSMSD